MKRIHYTKPSITEKEIEYATDAARNGWGEKCYEYIGRFEGLFKSHLGVKYAIATSSCTGALHVYGGNFFEEPRSEWNPENLLEEPYNVERNMALFEEANRFFDAA